MIKTVLKCIRKTYKKSFRHHNNYEDFPYICTYNTKIVGNVYKRRKIRHQYKRLKHGPGKYKVTLYDKGMLIVITHIYVTIHQTIPNPNSIFSDEKLLFKGSNITKDEHFNISMIIPNMPTSDEIEKIRSCMRNKKTRYKEISIYLTDKWCD